MRKGQRKRYLTANDIRAEIDRFKQKAQKLRESAAALDMKADMLFKAGPELAEDASFARETAKKHRRSADRIEERRLVRLKEKLAEWMTDVIPCVITDGDRSVSA